MARAGLDRRLVRLEVGRRGELPLLVLFQDLADCDLFTAHPSRPGARPVGWASPAGGPAYRRSDFDTLARSYRLVVVVYETHEPTP